MQAIESQNLILYQTVSSDEIAAVESNALGLAERFAS
jgi:hypothetical protein